MIPPKHCNAPARPLAPSIFWCKTCGAVQVAHMSLQWATPISYTKVT